MQKKPGISDICKNVYFWVVGMEEIFAFFCLSIRLNEPESLRKRGKKIKQKVAQLYMALLP